ncbi:MAG: glycosyltransferase family 2 protein [Anaerolineae bacterium]|nr:glycosyltransferase family 2 protein [Anaerolineae bacterium]
MWYLALLFQIAVFIIELVLLFFVGYLLLLTVVAWWTSRKIDVALAEPAHRFLVLIPAHNEERLLPDLLKNLNQLDYPADLFSVHVVADNCTDETAVITQQYGAIPHERFDALRPGKGFALQWFLQTCSEDIEAHDAVVMLDADTIVSTNFLKAMSTRLGKGETVIQAYYAVRNPEKTWGIGLRYAALAVLHYLRPLGRTRLGGSAGLKGNGMVFASEILKQYEWSDSITEDIEFHMALILGGERVAFAPEATIWAEMPETLAGAATQNVRWERGRLQMMRLYVPQLLKAAGSNLRHQHYSRTYLLLDAVMEHLIPPFSVLAALTGLSVTVSLFMAMLGNFTQASSIVPLTNLVNLSIGLGIILILGQAVYLLTGLYLVHAPKSVYLALLMVPLFVGWKIWHYLRVLLGLDSHGWVRTTRNNEV